MMSPAMAAVEHTDFCVCRLVNRPLSQAGQPTNRPPAELGEMYDRLQTVRAIMQRAADGQPNKDEVNDALLELDLVIVQFDETDGLHDGPLMDEFLFELWATRADILAHQDNRVGVPSDEDLSPPVTPDVEPAEPWNRKGCALEATRNVKRKVQALKYPPVLERAVAYRDNWGSLSGFLTREMAKALIDAENQLETDEPNFKLARRLLVTAQVLLIAYCVLDPQANMWSLKGAMATARENIEEAAVDPNGPRVY